MEHDNQDEYNINLIQENNPYLALILFDHTITSIKTKSEKRY